MTTDTDWTETDLALIKSLDAADTPLAMIARRLGRSEEAIAAKLPEARTRPQTLPIPWRDEEDEAVGPDEEGEVLPPTGRDDDEPAAWVHSNHKP